MEKVTQRFAFSGQIWELRGENIRGVLMKVKKKKVERVFELRKCCSCRYEEKMIDGNCSQKNCPKCERGLLCVEYGI
jgi:hypothetical protein